MLSLYQGVDALTFLAFAAVAESVTSVCSVSAKVYEPYRLRACVY
jgi:hypothetical protein